MPLSIPLKAHQGNSQVPPVKDKHQKDYKLYELLIEESLGLKLDWQLLKRLFWVLKLKIKIQGSSGSKLKSLTLFCILNVLDIGKMPAQAGASIV